MMLDFTLEKYAQLCETIRRLNYPVRTVQEFLKSGQPKENSILLRHDVDRQMGAALRMAELEADFGLRSTYYVRKQPSVFKPEAIKHLHVLGHEVGYHYEVLAKTRGDKRAAIQLFEKELEQFRKVVPVSTISMHGSPLSPWNNLELWTPFSFDEFDIIGDGVLSITTERLLYFTDTGRSWNGDRFNLRDHVNSRKPPQKIEKTDDLINFLGTNPSDSLYINAHPNRWAANGLSWGVGMILDWTINRAKWIIALSRLPSKH